MIIVPDCQGSRPSYSVELKYSPSSINHSTDKDCKTISIIDQIILALIITFLYKIFVHTLSWFAHKYIYGTSYTVYHFIMLLFIWLVFKIFPPILSFKTIILLLMHGSSWCTVCTLTVLLLMHGSVLLMYCLYSYSLCMGPLDAQFVLHGLEGCGFEL